MVLLNQNEVRNIIIENDYTKIDKEKLYAMSIADIFIEIERQKKNDVNHPSLSNIKKKRKQEELEKRHGNIFIVDLDQWLLYDTLFINEETKGISFRDECVDSQKSPQDSIRIMSEICINKLW